MKPKIGDIMVYIFIVILVGLSFLGIKSLGTHGGKTMVNIELDGKLIKTLELPEANDDIKAEEIRVDVGDGKYNIVRVSPQGVEVIDANCPDKLCVSSPTIGIPGQSIICIPHKLIIRITGEAEGGAVDDTAS